jgi:hypothetical protein
MTIRVLAALPLLAFGVGCVEDNQRALLVRPDGTPLSTTTFRPSFSGPRVPEHHASARRLFAVGRKLIDANPQAGLRPAFVPVGFPHPEIFHTGGGLSGYQITVSDGLINACKTDAELAAVLALEMGKIVAERESAAGPSLKQPPPRRPPEVPVGTDAGGTFGPPDGTRIMELARQEPKPGRRSAPAPAPEALAKGYLGKAGYDVAALATVGPLLHKAEGHAEMEKVIKTAEVDAPPSPAREKAVKTAELGMPVKPTPPAEPQPK